MNNNSKPLLIIVIDTEEEFDWSAPFSIHARSVHNIGMQEPLMDIYREKGMKPVYVIDHPVATTPESIDILKAYSEKQEAVIGTHLHPWVNPPYREEVSSFNSFPGNLPFELEYEKLIVLTQEIENNFQLKPVIYKAGRYGFGKNTARILEELGYNIDLSIVPTRSYKTMGGGPDFRRISPLPRFLNQEKTLLSVPMTAGYTGHIKSLAPSLYHCLYSKWGKKAKLDGIFSKMNFIRNVNISPEGIPLEEAKTLTRVLWKQGVPIFTLAYHSSSLYKGHNYYTRTQEELQGFINWVRNYLDFFKNELNGDFTTPVEIYKTYREGQDSLSS